MNMEEAAMTDERRQLLDSKLELWSERLELEDILIFLQAQNVFNEHVVDVIQSEKTKAMRRYQFIRQLKMRGNSAFVQFYRALLSTNQRSLAALLENELGPDEKTAIECCNFTTIRQRDRSADTLREVSENGVPELIEKTNRTNVKSLECSSFEKQLPTSDLVGISARAIRDNEMFYKDYGCVSVKEPSGVLEDLQVEYVDNKNANDLISFDDLSMYPNFTSPRGLALIINNRHFETMPERIGTDVDETNLRNLFRQLDYEVTVYRDLRSKEMIIGLQRFSRLTEHSKVDSCIIAVLTHGEHGELYGVDDIGVPVNEFISLLNAKHCPALAHKPKLFFLQACRGQRYDHGFDLDGDRLDGFFDRLFNRSFSKNTINTSLSSDLKTRTPIEADILVAYATTPGYVSWRNSMKGSWFIQAICEVFAKYSKKYDILSMLTMVNKRVAEAYESSSGAYKQIPDHSSRLRRNFYFFPGLKSPPS